MTDSQQRQALANMGLAKQYATAYIRCVPRHLADDLFQVAYLGLCKAAEQYDGSSAFPSYLWFKVRGEIKTWLKSEKLARWKRTSGEVLYDTEAVAGVIDDNYGKVIHLIEANEAFDWLTRDLTPLQRGLLVAKCVEDRVQHSLESDFGMKKSTISKHIRAAYDQIREGTP